MPASGSASRSSRRSRVDLPLPEGPTIAVAPLWISALTLGSFYGLLGLAYYLIFIGAGFFNIAIGAYASNSVTP